MNRTRAELLIEIGRAASRLGAPPVIISLIGGWESGHNDHAALSGLQACNDEQRGAPRSRRQLPVGDAIIVEIYDAFRNLGAPPVLLGLLGSWGDTFDDEETLASLRRYNRAAGLLDH
ncbi:MAG: hypothetical protein AB7F76_07895 [Parvibaculaceae bacterium]